MGKKRKDAAAPLASPSPTKASASPTAAGGAAGQQPADAQQHVASSPPLSLRERILPEGGVLPWWVVLVFSVYSLLKLGMTLEHPCGVLGTHAPVTRSQIQKAYRSLSVCTHPDKLVGFETEDVRRGELLFKRASSARESLIAELRSASQSKLCQEAKARRQEAAAAAAAAAAATGASEGEAARASIDEADDAACAATCSTQLDTAIWQGFMYVFAYFIETGGVEIVHGFLQFLYELVTFQYDVSMSISMVLLLMTAYRALATFVGYLRAEGPLTTVIAAVMAVIIGPLPTLGRFLVLPALRTYSFVRHELLSKGDGDEGDHFAHNSSEGAAAADGETTNGDAPGAGGNAAGGNAAGGNAAAAAAGGGHTGGSRAAPTSGRVAPSANGAPAELPKRNMKQHGRPPTKEELEEQREALLRGEAPVGSIGAGGVTFDADTPVSSMPLTEVLARKPLGGSRLHAAAAMQFDLLLSTTKYVIPLVALITTGQVFNGIFSSMMTAQVLHKVPAMRPELHHLLLVCVGLLHTLLCAGKSPLHEMHAPDGGALLQLTWSWSAKDVLAIANIVALGATFSSAAGGGNEPFFCTSFAAGIALRMVLYELMPARASSALAHLLRDKAKIELIGVDEVAVRAGRGVGTCSGGPVRFLLGGSGGGSMALAAPATLFVKTALLVLPALTAAQWALRCFKLVQRMRRESGRVTEKKLRTGELLLPVLRWRLCLSVLVGSSVATLVGYFAAFELNAVGSSLGNVLIIALAGCHFESLLATYDVRGRLRSAVFFVLFMLL